MGAFLRSRDDADHQRGRADAEQRTRRMQEQGTIPADALYRISVGKGYARVTSKGLIQQLRECFSCPFDNTKLPAHYDEEEDMLIAQCIKGGDVR